MKVEVKTTPCRYTKTLMYSVSMHAYILHNIKYFCYIFSIYASIRTANEVKTQSALRTMFKVFQS